MVIPPLQTIQIQMENICLDKNIPYINLSAITDPTTIRLKIEEVKPKVILSSIEDIGKEEVQNELHKVKISYVAIDECQVSTQLVDTLNFKGCF